MGEDGNLFVGLITLLSVLDLYLHTVSTVMFTLPLQIGQGQGGNTNLRVLYKLKCPSVDLY